MTLLFAALLAIIFFLSYLLFDKFSSTRRRRDSLRDRLSSNSNTKAQLADEDLVALDRDPSARARNMGSILQALGVDVEGAIYKLRKRFEQAGVSSPDAPYYYLFFQRIVSIGLLMVAMSFFMTPSSNEDHMMDWALGGVIAVLALFGPHLWLQNQTERRKKILQRAFPDTLDLLLICVESGLALDAALNRVCNELGRAYPEMTAELNRTRLELALINDRVRALTNLGDRTNMVQFRSLVAALIQSEKFGTSLSDTMRVLSEDFRLMRLSEAEGKAARLPVLLTVPLIFLLMPAFLLIVLGPAVVQFSKGGLLGGQ